MEVLFQRDSQPLITLVHPQWQTKVYQGLIGL